MDGPTRVGPFLICANGFWVSRGKRSPVSRDQVEAAKTVLAQFRRTRMVQPDDRVAAGPLKHDVENLARRYISRGALIIAALEMGIAVVPVYDEDWLWLSEDGRGAEPLISTAYVGVNYRDVERAVKAV
ncbi:hypothetical protein [Bradyrhizobium sp. CCGB01]|uniref:hypothetical protein n=1 Tax=Bradyrhizobium sp. CCGB01 TaxID=2949634 RepID=UPI0020B3668B|nr:hypothetical protein [Bradyrhizobium sp. CCGB01]MCP3408812.1 hypothetical protein [Bradyrhizobium sp. CCGB01]